MKNLLSLLGLLGLTAAGLSDEGADDRPRAVLRTVAVKRGSLEVTLRARGTVEPEEVIDVGAQVAGAIVELGRDGGKAIESGSSVEVGTVLAQIDPRRYRAKVDRARAGLVRAEADLALALAELQLAERPPQAQKTEGRAAQARRLLASLELRELLVQPSGAADWLTVADAEAIARECPAVQAAAPVRRARMEAVHGDRKWVPLFIYGTTPSYLSVRDWQKLTEGSPFTDRDVRSGAKVCLVGQALVHELFADASPLDQTIRLKGVAFRVIGVLSKKGSNLMGLDRDDVVLVPFTALDAVIGTTETKPRGAFDQIAVRARSADDVPAASREIAELLRKRHHIAQGQPDDFDIRDYSEMKKALENQLR